MVLLDGRTATLEEQVLKPSEDPNEMDLPIGEAERRVGLARHDLSHALATTRPDDSPSPLGFLMTTT